MKIRNGFVSNSSSSSFLILIRNDFNVSQITNEAIDNTDLSGGDKYTDLNGVVHYDKVRESINKYVKRSEMWSEEDDDLAYALPELLKENVISSFDTSSDAGFIKFIPEDNLRKMLGDPLPCICRRSKK